MTDNADAVPSISSNYQPGVSMSRGVWTVEYLARDDAGNEGNCTFVIYITGKFLL